MSTPRKPKTSEQIKSEWYERNKEKMRQYYLKNRKKLMKRQQAYRDLGRTLIVSYVHEWKDLEDV